MFEPEETNASETVALLEWIEPEVRELEVDETANQPFTGGDGYTGRHDCTRS